MTKNVKKVDCKTNSKKFCMVCQHYDYCDKANRCDGNCFICDDYDCHNNLIKKKKGEIKMRAILVSWHNEYAFGGDVVAYKNIFTGEVIDKKRYSDMLEREIVEMWHVIGKFGKKEYGTFENFRKCMLESPDTDFIPLVQVYVDENEDLEKYGDYIKLY